MVSESVDPPAAGAGGESIGALLARVRMEQGKSQLRVAELLCAASGLSTITRHEISRWEREERIPTSTWLRWLAMVLDTSLEELERAVAHTRGQREEGMMFMRHPSREPEALANRPRSPEQRSPGQKTPGQKTAGQRSPGQRSPGQRSATNTWPQTPPDHPAARRERLQELRRMDDLIAGPELAGLVHRELRAALTTVRGDPGGVGSADGDGRSSGGSAGGDGSAGGGGVDAAGEVTSRTARGNLSLVAGLAQLAGWVAADAGAPVSTLATYKLGLRAADRSGDRPLAGHLLGCLSQLTAEDGDPPAALRLARAAHRRAGSTATAGTRALLSLRLGYGAGLAGERRTCEEALAAAERACEQRQPRLDPDWLYWFDEAHFTAMVGRCYAALGRPRLARPLLIAALDAGSVRFRAQAITAAALARAHADAGDLDAACALAGEALMTCVRAGSVRATRQVQAVEPHLRAAGGKTGQPAAMRDYAELAASLRPFLPTGRGPEHPHTPGRDRPTSAFLWRPDGTASAQPGHQKSTMQDASGVPRPAGGTCSG